MSLEDNLRYRLEAVETPPSRVDVEMLVVAGRRRAFRRRSAEAAAGVALVAAVLLAVPWVLSAAKADPVTPPLGGSGAPTIPPAVTPSSTAAPALTVPADRPLRCAMEKLPVPSGRKAVVASAVDRTGTYIVGNDVVGQNYRAVLWTDGRPQALPVEGESVEATAVNSSGVVVGLVSEGAEKYVFRYHEGTFTKLATPPGDWHVYPDPAVNAAGDIVINAEPSGNSGGEGSIVLLWKAGAATATEVPLPTGADVLGIGDDGTLVGAMYTDGAADDAYVWDQRGNERKLKRPAGATTAAAYAVAGDWATGGVWRDSDVTAALWNIRTGAVTELRTTEVGQAVNASGWVIDALGRLVRDGAAIELATPDGQSGKARDVSDTGLVVGTAVSVDQEHEGAAYFGAPRVWRC
jgi:hypothetical protein